MAQANPASETFKVPTQDEIVKRFEERKNGDILGFEITEYLSALDFEHVKCFLKPEAKSEEWSNGKWDRESVLARMLEYMPFAWEKANDCRGISANRSIMHYIAWIWLAGEPRFAADVEQMFDKEYCYYGKLILEAICKYYGWDFSKWDDGVRTNTDG